MLRQGSTGPEVRRLQEALKAAGFDPGPIDGIFGPLTEAAVRAYQQANNLTVDGIVGPETSASIYGTSEPEPAPDPTTEGDDGLPPTGVSEEQDELIEAVTGGDPEIWYDSEADKWFLVYFVPNTDPPVPLLYEADDSHLEALFGETTPTADKIVTTSTIQSRGGIYAGVASDPFGNPYATFIEMLETEAQIRPWLMDEDMLAIMFEAALEGRQVTEGELMTTEWWRTHNEAERAWLMILHGDPMTAEAMIEDAFIQTRDQLQAMGVNNASDALVNFLATQVITGAWTQTKWADQIRAIADPSSGIQIDEQLQEIMGEEEIDTTQQHEERVRQTVLQWLGPVHGAWGDDQIAEWAGRLRNDPDGEAQLLEFLRGQRISIWPEYENENLTYDDIAGSWKTLWERTWGEDVDETDPLFDQLMRSENYTDGLSLMRTEGLDRGKEAVLNELEAEIAGTGRRVRRTQ